MHLVVHREIRDDEVLRRQWNDLVQKMAQPEVFYTYEWALAVHRAYRAQMVPLLLLAYEEDSLVGLVALATDSSQRETFFLTSTTADYCDFVCHPQRRTELLDSVLAELRKLDAPMLRLANLPADSVTSHSLKRAARKYGYSVFSRPAYSCAQVVIDSPENREVVKESVQRRMRRYAKAMGKKTPVKFSHCRSPGSISAELPIFAKAHVARFLATGRISNLVCPERRVFLEELARSLSASGWVTLSRLIVGEQVLAWNYGFQFAGSWFWYQPTFDSNFQRYSPGLWLLSKIVEESCENPELSSIDLGLGAEGYKERLATASRETLHVTVTTSTLRCWKERIRYHSAAAIRSIPRLEAWVRAGMHHAAALKTRLQTEGLAGYLKSLFRSCQKLLRDQSEFCFLEWAQEGLSRMQHSAPHSLAIQPVDLDLLATAAMHYVEDPETLAYLLRAADRLRSDETQGFVLVTCEGVPLHFCWATNFEKISATELKYPMTAPSSDCALIVDCWTPVSVRGQGYYREAIAGVGSQLQAAGKSVWIFASATNGTALRGAEEAGFIRKFSLLHKRLLFARKLVESQFSSVTRPAVEVSSAA